MPAPPGRAGSCPEIRPAGRPGRFQEGPIGRGRKVRLLTPASSGVRGVRGYWRTVPAISAGLQVIPTKRPGSRPCSAARSYCLFDPLAVGRRAGAHAGVTIKGRWDRPPFCYFRTMGSAVAVHDRRVTPGDNFALDARRSTKALTLGHSPDRQHLPGEFRILLAAARAGVRSGGARQLLARPGTRGLDAGIITGDVSYANIGEVVRTTAEVGIRVSWPARTRRLLPATGEKLKNIVQGASGAFGNCATRAEALRGERRRLRLRQLSRHRTRCSPSRRCRWTAPKRERMLHPAAAGARQGDLCADWQLAFISGSDKVANRVSACSRARLHGALEDLTLRQA